MKTRPFLLIVLFLLAATAAAQKDMESHLASLVATERAFAQTAREQGLRDSFLAYIADDGIIFRPGPVTGKKWLTENPPSSGLLSWEPAFADISLSGDLGYTTGPWEFRKNNTDEQPAAYGHFVTLWKKQANGDWKFVLDLGISHPQPAPKPYDVHLPLPLRKAGQKVNVEAERAALLKVDREFAQALASRGMIEAFLSCFTDDGRLYRNGAFPSIGQAAIRAALAEQPVMLSSQPARADVGNAGDLGYTYGAYEFKEKDAGDKPASRGNYLRIWKKQSDGRWKIVLDVANPLPPSTTS